jgi:hypothetical protein
MTEMEHVEYSRTKLKETNVDTFLVLLRSTDILQDINYCMTGGVKPAVMGM